MLDHLQHHAALVVTLLLLLRFAQLLLHCLWSRRYQVLDALIGSSQYTLLPSSYRAVEEGIIHVEGTDHALDDHGHDHDHGPHDIVVVAQRWAIVTGASRGIGRAFVRKLSDQGFSLLCIDRDDAELEDTVEVAKNRLERGWRGAVWPRTQVMPTAVKVGCDVAHVEDAIAKIEQAIRTLPQGSLRLLVNNVGMSTAMPSLLAQHDAKEIALMVHTNLLFAMQLTRALWPELTVRTADCDDDRRSGILFLSSAASVVPAPYASVYAATKGAINGFARALRAEALGLDVQLDVLAVTPGYVRAGNTPRWVHGSDGSAASDDSNLAEPGDVARACLLLLPTATSATMHPFFADAVKGLFAQYFLPESRLSNMVFERHQSQRQSLLGTNPTDCKTKTH